MRREPVPVRETAALLADVLGVPVLPGASLRLSTSGCGQQPRVCVSGPAGLGCETYRVVSPEGSPGDTNRALMRALGLAGQPVLGLTVAADVGHVAVVDVRLHLTKGQLEALCEALLALNLAPAQRVSDWRPESAALQALDVSLEARGRARMSAL